jgi:hypothetical protein
MIYMVISLQETQHHPARLLQNHLLPTGQSWPESGLLLWEEANGCEVTFL